MAKCQSTARLGLALLLCLLLQSPTPVRAEPPALLSASDFRADVTVLLSGLISHAEVDRGGAAMEFWRLIRFWADVLQK